MSGFARYANKIVIQTDTTAREALSSSTQFTCDKPMMLHQTRREYAKIDGHFHHQSEGQHKTHVERDNDCPEKLRKKSEWQNIFASAIDLNFREILRHNKTTKHIVSGYDGEANLGIEFQDSAISPANVKDRESITPIDWVFNLENQYMRRSDVGNHIIVEIPHKSWHDSVKECDMNVFLYTGKKEWLWLTDRNTYMVESEGITRHVWVVQSDDVCGYNDVFDNTCLSNILTLDGKKMFVDMEAAQTNIETTQIVYARCRDSMYLFDETHREYIKKYAFPSNSITAIKSVAGSGKTTTLLDLAKIHKKKRILYLAFNKNLISEIQDKLKTQKITNMNPRTFDSLMRSVYIEQKGNPEQIDDLRPNTIHLKISWFQGKSWRVKKQCIDYLTKFCRQVNHMTIDDYCKDRFGKPMPLLKMMWEKVVSSYVVTFDTIRKLVHINHWAREYIKRNYDMIFIDEAQDFDDLMLDVLLKDTDIPKIFVGDPMQAIYQWRGSINAFNKLPKGSLFMEFYSTFRIGNPACDTIRNMFDKCWMISKSKQATHFNKHFDPSDSYVYLFRSWKCLLLTAQSEKNIYIYGYDEKERMMISLHERLMKFSLSDEEKQEMEDDLPSFLLSYTARELKVLLNEVRSNLVQKTDAKCLMYTIHSFKGCEHSNVKLCEDVTGEEENLLYVALTRGMKNIDYPKM